MKTTPPLRLIRILEVEAKTGKSVPQIYKEMAEGLFPRSVATGPNTRAWVEAEIDTWIEQRIAARDTGTDATLRATNPHIGKGRRDRVKLIAGTDSLEAPSKAGVGEASARAEPAATA